VAHLLRHSVCVVVLQKYVDYYQVIPEPIDLRTIAQKIQSQTYQSLDDMLKDLTLMIQNAKYFNKPSSLIYKVCCDLQVNFVKIL